MPTNTQWDKEEMEAHRAEIIQAVQQSVDTWYAAVKAAIERHKEDCAREAQE